MILSIPDPNGSVHDGHAGDPDTPLYLIAPTLLGLLSLLRRPTHGRDGKAAVWAGIEPVALPVMAPQQKEGAA